MWIDKLALVLLIAVLSRIVYILVALSAAWCISLLFRDTTAAEQA